MKEDAEVGEHTARWDGRLYPSASSIPRPAVLSPSRRLDVLPPFIWLLWGADGSGPASDESVCVTVCQLRPFRWGPETNMSTYQTSLLNSSTGGKWEKTALTTISEAWKVISDRTCQGFMGDLLRVMKTKGENHEISFTKTKQRLEKNAIRSFFVFLIRAFMWKYSEAAIIFQKTSFIPDTSLLLCNKD